MGDHQSVGVGIIGCGNISQAYLENMRHFPILKPIGCADLYQEKAEQTARQFGLNAYAVDELLKHPDVEVILNLTIPSAHYEVSISAIVAGKSVYSEKPLAINFDEGSSLANLAQYCQVRLGCAPDTFISDGFQECSRLLSSGVIGEPHSGTIRFMGRGPEHFHEYPDFYYQRGGGPLYDMGPYYLSALVSMLGPVRSVTGHAHAMQNEREILNGPRAGEWISVEVPTTIMGAIAFDSGAVVNAYFSFDVWAGKSPELELYGPKGTLFCPDPNSYNRSCGVRRYPNQEIEMITAATGPLPNQRGMGLADMAIAMREERPHRANGDIAIHVLEIMEAFHISSQLGRRVDLATPYANRECTN